MRQSQVLVAVVSQTNNYVISISCLGENDPLYVRDNLCLSVRHVYLKLIPLPIRTELLSSGHLSSQYKQHLNRAVTLALDYWMLIIADYLGQ